MKKTWSRNLVAVSLWISVHFLIYWKSFHIYDEISAYFLIMLGNTFSYAPLPYQMSLLWENFLHILIPIYYPLILFSRAGTESLKGLKHEMMFFSHIFHPPTDDFELLFFGGKFLRRAFCIPFYRIREVRRHILSSYGKWFSVLF